MTRNFKGCNSIGQTMCLLSRGHQFEFHRPQDHWKLTWSLTLWPVGLIEKYTNRLEYQHESKNKNQWQAHQTSNKRKESNQWSSHWIDDFVSSKYEIKYIIIIEKIKMIKISWWKSHVNIIKQILRNLTSGPATHFSFKLFARQSRQGHVKFPSL
jgi:hypothetical protein